MYSERITAIKQEQVESKLGIQLNRYSIEDSLGISQYLGNFHFSNKLYDSKGRIKVKEHRDFISNERLLFHLDFTYACRYLSLILDSGGVGHLELWESQKILLGLVGKLEEQNYEQSTRGDTCDGILIADHKGGRQLGHTAIGRALIWHRLLSHPFTRSASIAVDEPGIHKVYEKDELIWNGLPFFLLPSQEQGRFLREKDQHWNFMDLGSNLTYYQAQQRSGTGTGIGTGATYDVVHGTEVSTYAYPDMLEMDLFPTLPQNASTLAILETTAFGRGNWWHEFSDAVRKGKKRRWHYLFIPFYAEPTKYRRTPPMDWNPTNESIMAAKKVEETSEEFVGKRISLSKEQLYWWESSYQDALATNSLNKFLSNYAITPEQSFQHSSVSALSAQTLDWMRSLSYKGVAYELEIA